MEMRCLTATSFKDAEKAFQYGAQSIILSNHGGRELDLYVFPSSELALPDAKEQLKELD